LLLGAPSMTNCQYSPTCHLLDSPGSSSSRFRFPFLGSGFSSSSSTGSSTTTSAAGDNPNASRRLASIAALTSSSKCESLEFMVIRLLAAECICAEGDNDRFGDIGSTTPAELLRLARDGGFAAGAGSRLCEAGLSGNGRRRPVLLPSCAAIVKLVLGVVEVTVRDYERDR